MDFFENKHIFQEFSRPYYYLELTLVFVFQFYPTKKRPDRVWILDNKTALCCWARMSILVLGNSVCDKITSAKMSTGLFSHTAICVCFDGFQPEKD